MAPSAAQRSATVMRQLQLAACESGWVSGLVGLRGWGGWLVGGVMAWTACGSTRNKFETELSDWLELLDGVRRMTLT